MAIATLTKYIHFVRLIVRLSVRVMLFYPNFRQKKALLVAIVSLGSVATGRVFKSCLIRL